MMRKLCDFGMSWNDKSIFVFPTQPLQGQGSPWFPQTCTGRTGSVWCWRLSDFLETPAAIPGLGADRQGRHFLIQPTHDIHSRPSHSQSCRITISSILCPIRRWIVCWLWKSWEPIWPMPGKSSLSCCKRSNTFAWVRSRVMLRSSESKGLMRLNIWYVSYTLVCF